MFNVTYRAQCKRTKKYKTESGALKGIKKWLLQNQDIMNVSAVLIAPNTMPVVFHCASDPALPNLESVKIDFYSTRKWQQLRVDAFVLYGSQCVLCGCTSKDGVRLHVDHIKPRSQYPELAFDINNLQILCEPCNLGKSTRYTEQWR